MAFCDACKSIDFRRLLIACLAQCRDRQAADDETDLPAFLPDESHIDWHHRDIFEVEYCAPACDLCNIIFQCFEKRPPRIMEDAKDLPLAFRPYQNKIEICYNTAEGLITLCRLDVYMDRAAGE
jgi:hypothetical protein